MRIYEVAKKYGKSSKELIDILRVEGFVVATHMNLLGEKELLFLQKLFETEKPFSGVKNQQKVVEPKKNQVMLDNSPQKRNTDTVPQSNDSSILPTVKNQPSTFNTTSNDGSFKKPLVEFLDQSTVSVPLHSVLIVEPMMAQTFAEKTKIAVNDIIVQLLRWGIITTKNQILKEETIIRLAKHYAVPFEKYSPKKSNLPDAVESDIYRAEKNFTNYNEKRSPVIVVIGHVDHGKTTLLDFIRNTRVTAKEKGGITQHIGAHEVKTSHGSVVFIDTPGHEAFTKIRQRGIRVADIAVLVVAADDGVMPQTVEAIKQAKAMNLVVIVAINKVDRVSPERIEIVKKQLIQYDLVPEDWGGDIICVPISAKTGKGVNQLLDMISLQSELMELKTSTSVPAVGYVLETKVERGRGIVATILCHAGVLRLGNFFAAGSVTGRITSMVDSMGKVLDKAFPSVPVQIAGFDGMPEIGESFKVITKDEYAVFKSKSTQQSKQVVMHKFSLDNAINIVLKADTDSSKEAAIDFITTLNKKSKKQFNVISATIGMLNESDVELAYNVTAQIVVMHTRIDSKALMLANVRKISIHQFDVIYKMTDFLKNWLAAQSNEKVVVRKKVGQAEVLRVFDIKGVGVIAGSIVKDGRFVKDGVVVALRNGKKVGEGKIVGLQRERKPVKEAHTGFECGFMVENIIDWQVGDLAECYINETEIHQL
ncbi:MAG TPA: translation initiation factor IF-2 [Patescibacteria group bacterium]|jgi:translation initiation factor IF-2|nr:translation initiation factor IF-2 [Patescibacteria group bacterium]